MNEDQEVELEAMMRQRKLIDSRLNRALGELLGSGKGAREVILAADELESLLRAISSFAARVE